MAVIPTLSLAPIAVAPPRRKTGRVSPYVTVIRAFLAGNAAQVQVNHNHADPAFIARSIRQAMKTNQISGAEAYVSIDGAVILQRVDLPA